jgi:hypothetical protein
MKLVLGITFATPILLELIPTLVVFLLNGSNVICGSFDDPDASVSDKIKFLANFSVPFTCETKVDITPGEITIRLAQIPLSVIMLITILAWFVIVVSNLSIILMILKQARKPINREDATRRKRMTKSLFQNSVMVVFIAALFFATTFPYTWTRLSQFLHTIINIHDFYKSNLKVTLYFTMLTFVPVIVHPWLYLLRMKSVKALSPKSKRSTTFSAPHDDDVKDGRRQKIMDKIGFTSELKECNGNVLSRLTDSWSEGSGKDRQT